MSIFYLGWKFKITIMRRKSTVYNMSAEGMMIMLEIIIIFELKDTHKERVINFQFAHNKGNCINCGLNGCVPPCSPKTLP